MNVSRQLLLVCGLVLALPSVAFARQADADGSKDHPLVPRMAGFYISSYDAKEFNGHTFLLEGDKEERVEGRFWEIEYWVKEGAKTPSPLEIAKNYRNAFVAKGGVVRLADEDGANTVIMLKQGGGELWFECDVSNGGEVYTLTIVERAALAQQVELTAASIAAALKAQGSLVLRNILFETGKAALTPASTRDLQLVAEVLTQDQTLRLEIQGHTDNVGQPAANRTLSQQRADAVREFLITTGRIAAARLTAVGYGDTRPVGPNTTDEGRALNRRVEIVKK
jgi:outer membrane protein OmpA-like peptidoglycan-associated protein